MLLFSRRNPTTSPDLATDEKTNAYVTGIALAAMLVLGFFLRCLLIARGGVVSEDGAFYIWRAEKLMALDLWNGISAYWSPVYSLLTGLVGLPFQNFESGGRGVSLLAGTLLIPVTYVLSVYLYDRVTALIAALLVTVHPSLILVSSWVMTESLYTLLFVGMIACGWLALRGNRLWHWALTGSLIGLLYLTKPEALGFLLLFIPFSLVVIAFDRTNLRSTLAGLMLMCFVAASFVVPYVVFVNAKVGEWTLSKKVSTNTPRDTVEGNDLNLTRSGNQTTMDQIWSDEYLPTDQPFGVERPEITQAADSGQGAVQVGQRLEWALFLTKRQIHDLIPALISFAFFPFIIIGFFSSPWGRYEAARTLYLGAFLVATIVGYSFAVVNIRYLFPIIPLMIIWTAYGVVAFSKWLSATLANTSSGAINLPTRVVQIASVVVLISVLTPSVVAHFGEDDIREVPLEEQRAGVWLRSQASEGSMTVMASHSTVAYYAGANHLFLPNEDVSTIVEYARRRNTNFIVFSSRRVSRNKNGFPTIPPEMERDLELVYSDEVGDDYKVQIYKVRL